VVHGTVWHSMAVLGSMAQHEAAWHSTAKLGTARNMAQQGAAWRSGARHGPACLPKTLQSVPDPVALVLRASLTSSMQLDKPGVS
jgi:hypothetical protein